MLHKVISIILIGTILAGCAPVLVDQQVETKQERNTDLQLDSRYDHENDEVFVTAMRRFSYNNYSRNKDIYVTRASAWIRQPGVSLLATAGMWGFVFLCGLPSEGTKDKMGKVHTRDDTVQFANYAGGLIALMCVFMPHPTEDPAELKSMYHNGTLGNKYKSSKIIKEEAGSWKLSGTNENKYAAIDLPVSLTIPADYSDKLSVDNLRSLTDKSGKTSFKLNPNPDFLDKQSSGSGAKYVDLALRAENASSRVSAGPYRIKQPSPSAPVASYRNETASNQESSISESAKKMPEYEKETVQINIDGNKQYSALKKDKRNNVILRINPEAVVGVHLNGRPAANALGSYMAVTSITSGRTYFYMIGSLKSGSHYLSYNLDTANGFVNVVEKIEVTNTQKEYPLGGRTSSRYANLDYPLSDQFKILDPIMGASKAYKTYKLAGGIAEMLYSSDDKYNNLHNFGDYFKAANALYKDSDLRSKKMDEVWKQIERVQKGYTNALEAKQTIDQILGL